MIAFPEGSTFNDVYVYRSSDSPSTFFYIPGPPQPRLTSVGKPAFSLIAMGEMAFLTMEARWVVPQQQLETLEALLTRKLSALTPGKLQLVLAPVSVDQAQLMLGEEQDGAQELEATAPSGSHPFTALFNARLDAKQRAQALSALNGRRGVLRVVYQIRLAVPVVISVTLEGDVSAGLDLLGRSPQADALQGWIASALTAGRLRIERKGPQEAPSNLWKRAEQQVKERFAEMLRRMTADAQEGRRGSSLKATVRLAESVDLPLERTADVATWFEGQSGMGHVQLIGG
ncbi:MAG: hypothetical protein JXB05_02770 [Myxococcaceae bacterium]|nr:hypothetical protein [Myxococcaceae bacterium]